MNNSHVACAIYGAVLAGAILALAMVPSIHRWEKAQNYPYGKMCHSIFTLYQDNCK